MNRPWQINNEEEWLQDCRDVVQVSRSILNQTMGVTDGARRLAALRFRVRAESDSDFLVFAGIDSETDNFPLGDIRSRWSQDALARSDGERKRIEAHWRQSVEMACRSLIHKYEDVA